MIQEIFPEYHGVAWYWHEFTPAVTPQDGERLILRFGAVDYKATVWLNGTLIGEDENGESAIEFEVTDQIRLAQTNLLTVRVLNPCEKTIDGLNLTNTPNRNKELRIKSGCTPDFGGFLQDVTLFVREKIAVTDLFAIGDIHTGKITAHITLDNASAREETVSVHLSLVDRGGIGEIITDLEETLPAAPGHSVHTLFLHLDAPILWDIDDPYLYRLNVTLTSHFTPSFKSVRFGFREFLVKDGFFYLNGRRIFLKCSHTGNNMPIGLVIPKIKAFTREDFTYAKAAGFNTLRACAMLFRPEQLDYCDEIGLMIMDECYAAWRLGIGGETKGDEEACYSRFDKSVTRMVLQDRVHPCVSMYQLLNGTGDEPAFYRAVGVFAALAGA